MTVIFIHGIGAGAESFHDVPPLVPGSVALNLPGWGDEPWGGEARPSSLRALRPGRVVSGASGQAV